MTDFGRFPKTWVSKLEKKTSTCFQLNWMCSIFTEGFQVLWRKVTGWVWQSRKILIDVGFCRTLQRRFSLDGRWWMDLAWDIWSGWWFGTFFCFPYIGNNHPNWLIFFRGVQTTNQWYILPGFKVAIENCLLNSGSSHWTWWFLRVMLFYQRVSDVLNNHSSETILWNIMMLLQELPHLQQTFNP